MQDSPPARYRLRSARRRDQMAIAPQSFLSPGHRLKRTGVRIPE